MFVRGDVRLTTRAVTLTLLLALGLPPTTIAADATATTTLSITGMSCGGCVAAVKLELEKTGGVTAYDVSLEKAEATVTYDPAVTTPERIAESVSKTGFEASVKEPGAAKTKGACSGASCQQDCCKDARASPPAPDGEHANLVSLAQGLSPLVAAFNAAKDRPRFLAILSPTCSACVHGAEAIQTAVLPAKDTVDVFVVWAPMLDSDGAAEAAASSAILAVPNVQQFWDPERRTGTSLRKDVFPDAVERMRRSLPRGHFFSQYLVERDKSQPEWDMYLLFEPGAEWTDRAPRPARWVRQTARFAKRDGGELTSLLWVDDYAGAPMEGSLPDQLRRLLPRPSALGAVR